MKRIKGLIVAALTVAAVAAVPVSASAAAGISAEKYPSTLSGSQTNKLEVGVNGGFTWSCSGITLGATLSGPSSTVTTSSLTNGECGGATLVMNNCQLVLDPGGVQTVGIGGASCTRIKIWNGAPCGHIEIPVQSGIATTYANQVGGGFNVAISDTTVDYYYSNCSPTEVHHNLRLVGTFKVTGGTVTIGGLYVGGGSEGQFEAADYPAGVAGERFQSGGKAVVLKTPKAEATCTTAAYTGSELTKAASSLTLNVAYSGCKTPVGAATISMNSCRYVYSELKKSINEGEYSATAKIACNEGDAIKITSGGCILTIPSQTLSGGEVGFTSLDLSGEAILLGLMNASGVTYTSSGAWSCEVILGLPKGTYTNGISESGMLLRGVF